MIKIMRINDKKLFNQLYLFMKLKVIMIFISANYHIFYKLILRYSIFLISFLFLFCYY